MEQKFSSQWKASKQVRKKRKYLANAPLNIKRKMLSAHLADELMKKYKRRNFPVRKGDKVKIMRGQFKNQTGNINKVNIRKTNIYIDGAEVIKRDGTKSFYPIHPSNVMIQELNLEDKLRKKAIERLIAK